MNKPIEIFCCVAESDRLFLEKLCNRLTVQQRDTIKLWDRSQIQAGENVNREIRRHLASARIFLLLIGPDFLDNDYCYNTVMKTALERYTRGNAITIPVIVGHADSKNIPILKDIQVLPKGGKPISSPDKDDELWEVTREIGKIIAELGGPPVGPSGGGSGHTDLGGEDSGHRTPPPLVRAAITLMHVLQFLVTKRPGWALIGALVLLSGVLWGVSSPTVAYLQTPEGSTPLTVIPMKNGDLYISAPENPSTFYVAHCNDLSPHLDCATVPSNNSKLGFYVRPEPISVNSKVRDDVTGRDLPVSQAFVIEELDVYNPLPTAYRASDYNSDHTFYENRWWPVAVALIAVGLVIVYVSLFMWRKRGRGA